MNINNVGYRKIVRLFLHHAKVDRHAERDSFDTFETEVDKLFLE